MMKNEKNQPEQPEQFEQAGEQQPANDDTPATEAPETQASETGTPETPANANEPPQDGVATDEAAAAEEEAARARLRAILGEEGAERFADARDAPLAMTGARRLPKGFTMTPRGLRYSDEDVKDQIVTREPFDVLGGIADPDGSRPGTVIGWETTLGRKLEACVPDSLLFASGAALPAFLADAGLRCAVGSERALKFFFSGLRPHRHILRCAQPGWQPTGAYVFADGSAVGAEPGTHFLVNRQPERLRRAGTEAGWRGGVAALARSNSRMVFAISVAASGPVLEPADASGLGFHFVGPSSCGKTTAMEAGCSFWGRPDPEDQMGTWRGSDNGVEGVASRVNNALLARDEIGQANPDVVKDVIYMLANGAGKQRAATDGGARKVMTWRVALLSTGERSPETIVRYQSRRGDSPAGLDVRLLDIPADAGFGMGAFENLHGHPTPKAFAEAVHAAAIRDHGWGARAFVARLVEWRAADPGWDAGVRARIDATARRFTPAGASAQVGRAASKFAVAAVSGELLREAGVVDWEEGEAEAAARYCFEGWVAQRGSVLPREELDVLRAMADFLGAHGSSRFEPLATPPPPGADEPPFPERTLPVRERAGWAAQDEFVFTSGAFKAAVAPAPKRYAVEVLHRHGLMQVAGSQKRRMPGFQGQVYVVKAQAIGWTEGDAQAAADAALPF